MHATSVLDTHARTAYNTHNTVGDSTLPTRVKQTMTPFIKPSVHGDVGESIDVVGG